MPVLRHVRFHSEGRATIGSWGDCGGPELGVLAVHQFVTDIQRRNVEKICSAAFGDSLHLLRVGRSNSLDNWKIFRRSLEHLFPRELRLIPEPFEVDCKIVIYLIAHSLSMLDPHLMRGPFQRKDRQLTLGFVL